MAERRAVSNAIAIRYAGAEKRTKSNILDELCATTGWHRNHARKALARALRPAVVSPQRTRTPTYGSEVIAALTVCWMVLGMPAGKRLVRDDLDIGRRKAVSAVGCPCCRAD